MMDNANATTEMIKVICYEKVLNGIGMYTEEYFSIIQLNAKLTTLTIDFIKFKKNT